MFPLYDVNRSRHKPYVNWILIGLNVIVFLFQILSEDERALILNYGVVPIYILHGERLYTLFTSMFMHANLFHIFGNMLYLWIFGDNVEDRFGHLKYLFLYLFFGLMGDLLHILMAYLGGDPYSLLIPAIGASGAISGVLGAYMIFYPRARIVTLVFAFYFIRTAVIPSIFFIGFWFLLQLLYATFGTLSGVAAWAHVGGFVAGMILALLYRSRPERVRWTTIYPE